MPGPGGETTRSCGDADTAEGTVSKPDYRRLQFSVLGLSNATLLYGLGILDSPDSLPLEVVLPDGRSASLTLYSSSGGPPAYVGGAAYWQFFADGPAKHAFSDAPDGLPIHLRHSSTLTWTASTPSFWTSGTTAAATAR